MGGHLPNPTYKEVCAGSTGHVEVVQVTFDPAAISYREILEIFFSIHDPTTVDRQGNDVGSQYRSAIFYHSPDQERTATQLMEELKQENTFEAPVVTEVRPAEAFYIAENYHQEYFQNNPHQPYCMFVVAPKVMKFRDKFAARSRALRAERGGA
jgi:peptide-methionine (S)-S-oxide reductase